MNYETFKQRMTDLERRDPEFFKVLHGLLIGKGFLGPCDIQKANPTPCCDDDNSVLEDDIRSYP